MLHMHTLGLITPRVLLMNNSFDYLDHSLVSSELPCPCLLLYYMEVTSHLSSWGPQSHQSLILSKLTPSGRTGQAAFLAASIKQTKLSMCRTLRALPQEMHASPWIFLASNILAKVIWPSLLITKLHPFMFQEIIWSCVLISERCFGKAWLLQNSEANPDTRNQTKQLPGRRHEKQTNEIKT